MLVAGKMQQTAARDGRKGPRRLVVGPGLELERADHVAAGIGGQPFPHGLQQAVRVADHVREQPVHLAHMARLKAEAAAQAVVDAGHGRHLGRQPGLVHAEHAAAQPPQHPGPAARRGAQVDAQFPRRGRAPGQGEDFPQLEVGAARRVLAVFHELHLPVGKG